MLIGITGSYGSGKTTIAKMFEKKGAVIIDADKICQTLLNYPKPSYRKIVNCFGRGIVTRNKAIDRCKLARIVFKDKSKLRILNKLIHPLAIVEINKIIKGEKKKKTVILDAPLLVETTFYRKMDKLIVVKNNRDKQIERTCAAKGISRAEALGRIRMQASLKKKLALADFIIDNSGSKKRTLFQVEKIWKTIRSQL